MHRQQGSGTPWRRAARSAGADTEHVDEVHAVRTLAHLLLVGEVRAFHLHGKANYAADSLGEIGDAQLALQHVRHSHAFDLHDRCAQCIALPSTPALAPCPPLRKRPCLHIWGLFMIIVDLSAAPLHSHTWKHYDGCRFLHERGYDSVWHLQGLDLLTGAPQRKKSRGGRGAVESSTQRMSVERRIPDAETVLHALGLPQKTTSAIVWACASTWKSSVRQKT